MATCFLLVSSSLDWGFWWRLKWRKVKWRRIRSMKHKDKSKFRNWKFKLWLSIKFQPQVSSHNSQAGSLCFIQTVSIKDLHSSCVCNLRPLNPDTSPNFAALLASFLPLKYRTWFYGWNCLQCGLSRIVLRSIPDRDDWRPRSPGVDNTMLMWGWCSVTEHWSSSHHNHH